MKYFFLAVFLVATVIHLYASLKKKIVLLGVDDHVEIWDEAAWNAYNDENDLTEILGDLQNVDL